MNRFFFALLITVMTALPAMAAPTNTTGPWGIDAGGFKNLSTALASPATVGKVVVVSKVMAINNKTVNGNRSVKVVTGGRIDCATGKTVTFEADSGFEAGDTQAFGDLGSVVLPAGTWPASAFGVSTTATAASNSTNIMRLLAAVPDGSTIVWPAGVIQINAEIAHTRKNQKWVSLAGGQTYSVTGTTFKQIDSTKRVLNITGDSNTFVGLKFDGNGTVTDTVYVGAPSTGQTRFQDCTFTGCASTDPAMAALNIGANSIQTQVYNCSIVSNPGNGLRLGPGSNLTDVQGGMVVLNATGGTANTAGIVCDSGNTSSIINVAVEQNGKSSAATTGGVLVNNSGRLMLRLHCEQNYNYHVKTNGAFGADIDIFDGYYIASGITPTAFVLDNGPQNIRIRGNYSVGHTNFISVLSTMQGLVAENNNTLDANYFKELSYNYTALRNWKISDLLYSPQNLIKYPPPSLWSITVAGLSKWQHDSSVKFNDRPSILLNKDGSNNDYATYTIPISASNNSILRGRWVTLSFYAATSDSSARNLSYSLTDGISTATATYTAGASYNWVKLGGSIKVDAAATSLTIIIAGVDAGYNIYVNGMNLMLGIDTLNRVDNPPYGDYRLSAVPTTGTWEVGERVINSIPTVGQPKAWTSTASGSPGTWASEGNL